MIDPVKLRDAIDAAFNLDDVQILCANLGLDYENLKGDTKAMRIIELVKLMQRQARERDLVQACKRLLPSPAWQVFLLDPPEDGRPGVLVDMSHKQSAWPFQRDKSVFGVLDSPPVGLTVRAVDDADLITVNNLTAWRGLLLASPFNTELSTDTIRELAAWVRQGGRLVLLGSQLSDRHHQSNLNQLADTHFGLRFNTDIIAPKDVPDGAEKPWRVPMYVQTDAAVHAIFQGVSRLCWCNVCSITYDPGADVLLHAQDNRAAHVVVGPGTINYIQGGALKGPQQRIRYVPGYSHAPIVVQAPKGLTGKGDVIGIGTWNLLDEDGRCERNDNAAFVGNVLAWLARTTG